MTAAFVELAETGILEWSADQRYPHDPVSVVTGSDGEIYFSQAPSGGDDPSEDPTTDTEQARWRQLELTVPTSTMSRRGTIEQATNTEAMTGDRHAAVGEPGAGEGRHRRGPAAVVALR